MIFRVRRTDQPVLANTGAQHPAPGLHRFAFKKLRNNLRKQKMIFRVFLRKFSRCVPLWFCLCRFDVTLFYQFFCQGPTTVFVCAS